MTPLTRPLGQASVTTRLADALARIIDDPLVVKLLMVRDPQAWVNACEALSAAGYELDDDTASTPPAGPAGEEGQG